jgi:hypothetical protein
LKRALFLTFASLLLVSCEKSEGLGGTGSITGTVTEMFYNDDFSRLIYAKPAVDEEIYIVYGDKEELGSRVRTNHLGQFIFKYLYPGNYTIYYISADSTSVLDMDMEKLLEVELERGEEHALGSLEKLTTLDYDDGTATIKGVVKVIEYMEISSWPNLVVEKSYFAIEHEVYLTYNNHTFYEDRIHTQAGGVFEFGGLIPGEYVISLHSDDVTGESDKVTLKFEVTIDDLNQVVDLGEIIIEKL